jgi:argininosuccinate synthase
MAGKPVKKVVLAYSGGLDTSIILKWLQTEYGAEVITFTADLGQGEEIEPARAKALAAGVKPENIFIEDVREEFVRDFVFPMFRANTVYEGQYLLGTSIARPLIAKKQIEIARKMGADAVSHGATGKGNDQVRFELGYYGLEPDIHVIAPWREWDFKSREALLDFAEKHQIQIAKDKRGEAPFSVDANLLHSSSEGKVLEDPAVEAPEFVHMRTIAPEDAPDKPTVFTMDFEKGDPVAIDGVKLSPAALLTKLNELGRDNGVGRLDLVENRFVGMKSRGVYETPGGTILLAAHRGIESITLDRGAMHLKDELMPKYASLVYNGFWFAPEREMLQAAIDYSQAKVTGQVRVKLYKGNVSSSAAPAPIRSTTRTWSPSRRARSPTTTATPAASSSSTPAPAPAVRLRVLAKRDKREARDPDFYTSPPPCFGCGKCPHLLGPHGRLNEKAPPATAGLFCWRESARQAVGVAPVGCTRLGARFTPVLLKITQPITRKVASSSCWARTRVMNLVNCRVWLKANCWLRMIMSAASGGIWPLARASRVCSVASARLRR